MKARRIGLSILLVGMILLLAVVQGTAANASPNYSTYTNQPDDTLGFDTYLEVDFPDSNYGTAASALTLVNFDLSSIPSNATIVSATLTLTLSVGSMDADDYNIYRVLRDWSESQATWNSWSTSNSWTTAGCNSNGNDADLSTAWSTIALSNAEAQNTPIDFVFSATGIDELQKVIGGTYTNYGWKIIKSTGGNAYSFYSSSSTTSTYRPKLVIEYNEATPTPTITETPTETPTPTATPTPSIIWADGPVTLSAALLDAIETLLLATPPADAETNVYAVTNVSGVDTAWNVSLVNLVDVAAPYDVWDSQTNAVWAWFVECTGTEPTWTCDYYELPAGGGSGSLRFPWRTGYWASYGSSGVHEYGLSAVFTGAYAVDFVGKDSWPGSMPPVVVAAADGTITWVCGDNIGMAISVTGGPVQLMYYHFAPGQPLVVGQTIRQGQVLGQLQYGTFNGSLRCTEHANQASDQYHLHFIFYPTSPGFLEIGGCVLDLDTEAFVCNANTYNTGGHIPNGGGTSNPTDPNDPNDSGGFNATGGGAHIWDGIVDAIVKLSANTISQYLPDQNPMVGYVLQKMELLGQALMSLSMTILSMGFSSFFLQSLLLAIINMEVIYWGVAFFFWIGRLIF
jgi:hypothetical protein